MSEPDLDVIVFGATRATRATGATGATGHRVAAYLSEQSAQTGPAGRPRRATRAKLERILAEDGVGGASLSRMASRTKVVLNLVGPYTLCARPVIEACITGGTHYLDPSGEIPFVRQVIDDFDGRAKDANVKLDVARQERR